MNLLRILTSFKNKTYNSTWWFCFFPSMFLALSLKFSFLDILVIFQMFNSYIWLSSTILDGVGLDERSDQSLLLCMYVSVHVPVYVYTYMYTVVVKILCPAYSGRWCFLYILFGLGCVFTFEFLPLKGLLKYWFHSVIISLFTRLWCWKLFSIWPRMWSIPDISLIY